MGAGVPKKQLRNCSTVLLLHILPAVQPLVQRLPLSTIITASGRRVTQHVEELGIERPRAERQTPRGRSPRARPHKRKRGLGSLNEYIYWDGRATMCLPLLSDCWNAVVRYSIGDDRCAFVSKVGPPKTVSCPTTSSPKEPEARRLWHPTL